MVRTEPVGVVDGEQLRETAHASPDKRHLAICSEVRTMLGFRVHQAGMLFSIEDGSIVGRIAMGKRTPKGWIGATG